METSTFGSEFVAACIAVELIESLRYKLRMFGVPLVGPANMFCDNNWVVVNCTIPESTLKKKHYAIAYHKVREAVAQGTIRIAKEDTKTNLADILTKPLPGPRMKELLYHILYWCKQIITMISCISFEGTDSYRLMRASVICQYDVWVSMSEYWAESECNMHVV